MARRVVLGGLLLAVLAFPAIARQEPPTLLIVSQPSSAGQGDFVDFGPYLARELAESTRFRPLVYRPSLPAVRKAVEEKRLAPGDAADQLNPEAIRRVATALGAVATLRVSGRRTKDGVAADAEMEALSGQATWTTVFLQKLDPFRGKRRTPSVLEGTLAHVATLVQKITAAPVRIGASDLVPLAPEPAAKPGAHPAPATPDGAQPDVPAAPARDADEPRAPNPAAVSPWEAQAEKFRRQNDTASLIVALRRAVTDKPRDAGLRRQLIQAYNERGWDAAARDEALRALALAPQDAVLRRLLGDSHLAAGDSTAAIREYAEAVRLDPKDARAWVALGDAHWSAAAPEEALKAFVAASEADPRSPLPCRRLARLHAQRGRWSDCLAAWTRAKELTPAEDPAEFNRDTAALLQIVETSLGDSLLRLQAVRKALLDGSRTREQCHGDATAERKRVEEAVGFLEQMPAMPAFLRIRDLYAQAGALAGQAVEAMLLFVETQETARDEEATLMRVEAVKQMADAGRRLKALLAAKPAG